METPSINEILQNIQYRFKENLESNLTVIPTSQAALIIFATKVLTETITEVAFDTLQNAMTGKPFPFETDVTYGRRAEDIIPAPTLPSKSQPLPPIIYPWTVANVGHILHAYEVYPNLPVTMYTFDAARQAWVTYFLTNTREAFQAFCNSMTKEDPSARYKVEVPPYVQLEV